MKKMCVVLLCGMAALLEAGALHAAQIKNAPLYLQFWTLKGEIAEPVELTIEAKRCPEHFARVQGSNTLCGRNVLMRVEVGYGFETHAINLSVLQYKMEDGKVQPYIMLAEVAAGAALTYHVKVETFSDIVGARMQQVGVLDLAAHYEEEKLVDVAVHRRTRTESFMAEARKNAPSTKHVWCAPEGLPRASL